jgi:predicted amidohydrolase YtcJ
MDPKNQHRMQINAGLQAWIIGLLTVALVCTACSGQATSQPTLPVRATNTSLPPEPPTAVPATPIDLAEQPLPVQGVTASAQQAGNPAQWVVDGDQGTAWISGADAPQWIEIDLGEVYHLEKILLHVSQYPDGETHHQIWAALKPGNYLLLTEFSGATVDQQTLTFQPETLPTVRFLKIETTQSPSWVAWREIEVFGSPAAGELTSQPAQIIFHNGNILTMDDEQPTAQALAISGEKILAVGSNEQVLALKSDQTRLIDLQGKTLMPGFIDTHAHLFGRSEPPYNDEQQLALNNGITSIGELYVDQPLLDNLRAFEQSGELKMRVSLYLAYNNACGDILGDWYRQYPPTRNPGELLRVNGVKIYSDGGACNVPAYSFDFPGLGKGNLYFTRQELLAVMKDVDAGGYQLAIHTLGDRSLDVILDGYDDLLAGGENPLRHRVEHNALVRPDQMGRYNANHLVLSIFGAYPICRRVDKENPLKFIIPSQYQAWEWPWRQLIDANPDATIVWQSDAPNFGWQYFEPARHLYGFVVRKEIAEDGHVCQPPEEFLAGKIRVDEALRMMTIDAAYALFRDQEVGSLRAGKYADLILLSDDPLGVPAEELSSLQVQMTMVNGETVYCADLAQGMCAK